MKYAEIPVNEIVHSRYSGETTRIYDSETFAGLSKSVKKLGVSTPIVVTDKNENGMYMVIDGDHRLEAAKAAGLETIPVVINTTVDPDKPNRDEQILNFIHNTQRVNLTNYEAARIYEAVSRDCSHDQTEEVKARMGLSRYRTDLYNKLNRLDVRSAQLLEQNGLDSDSGLIDALLTIRSSEDREDALDRAFGMGLKRPDELTDFISCISDVINLFPKSIQAHFNGNELPFTKPVIAFLSWYGSEEKQMELIEKFHGIQRREMTRAAENYLCLLTGQDPDTGKRNPDHACPEMENIILSPEFPFDREIIRAVADMCRALPEEPEKRLHVVSELFECGRLTEDCLIRTTRLIERSFSGYPDEVRDFFWNGTVQFSDYSFRILDQLLSKTYDLPTKLEMIDEAGKGKPSPDQFEKRLAKAIRERDEMIREVAAQSNVDPECLKNDEDIMRVVGMPESDISRIRSGIGGETQKPERESSGYDRPSPVNSGVTQDASEDEDETYEYSDYMMLADSMARSQNTSKIIELELLEKGENETIRLAKLYRIADVRCRKCRGERIFNFETVNYCDGCMMSGLIGDVEDSIGED